jgi:hypothetical protein
MRYLLPLAVLLGAGQTIAAPSWQFAEPVTVSDGNGENRFHHLESSGRRNIAVAGDSVAVAWEDDRDGTPRIYLARKALAGAKFAEPLRLSGDGEAYEPSLAALDGGRFAVAWEEDARVRLRLVSGNGAGPVVTLPAGEGVQPSLLYANAELLLVASEREYHYPRIVFHRFAIVGNELKHRTSCAVDAEEPKDAQLYPTLAVQQGATVVAWEDRRPGHTIIMASRSMGDETCRFSKPQRISLRPGDARKMPYGRGHGVARVALASFAGKGIVAAWADKRDFREGYDIYASHWTPKKGFVDNVRVQDEFGGVAQQWHATLAGDDEGRLLAAWDDGRDGDSNIMYSWYDNGEWSEDLVLPGADGAGEQVHPSITLDSEGNLHAAWVEREVAGGPTRLKYLFGRH